MCIWNVTGKNGGSNETIDLTVEYVCLMGGGM